MNEHGNLMDREALPPVGRYEMREADRRTIQDLGVPGIALMENAAMAVVRAVADCESCVVAAAVGNNGGDGLAAARHLVLLGKPVVVFLAGDPEKGSPDFRTNLRAFEKVAPGALMKLDESSLVAFRKALENSEVALDALFGTGLSRPVEGFYAEVVKALNVYAWRVVAVDIPSGLDCDTGRPLGTAVRAHQTVTFHRMKKGFLEPGAKACTGEVQVAYIGIAES